MRKGSFGDGLYIIIASTVATLGSWFRFHGGKLGSKALGMPYFVQPAEIYLIVVSMAYLCSAVVQMMNRDKLLSSLCRLTNNL
jgi:hypothetical protein